MSAENGILEKILFILPPCKKMNQRLSKKLSPKSRKLLLSDKDNEELLVCLEYSSAHEQNRVVQALTDKGIKIRSIQQEVGIITIVTTVGMLEEIAAIPGILYVETKSYFNEPDNFNLDE